jgi:hypothetical protein
MQASKDQGKSASGLRNLWLTWIRSAMRLSQSVGGARNPKGRAME